MCYFTGIIFTVRVKSAKKNLESYVPCNFGTIRRLSFRKIVKGGQKLNVENFGGGGGALYRVGVVSTA